MLDTVGSSRERPIIVHALPETIQALKDHIFNWVIWPDFTEIPHFERPWMVYSPLQVGHPVQIGNRTIRPITANHTVPAVGFHIGGTAGSLVYSGDTLPTEEFWRTVNGISDLRHLILERPSPTASVTWPSPPSTCTPSSFPKSWPGCVSIPRYTSRISSPPTAS